MSSCAKCNKKVTKWEEANGVGKFWHKACFTCGGTGTAGGCKKVLLQDQYQEKDEQPYCSTCYIRLFSKGPVFTKPVSDEWVDDIPSKPQLSMLAPKIEVDANKCSKCSLNVYKSEEILAAARHWHKACFTCGGTAAANDGCKRVLTVDAYLDHNTDPYCVPCFQRLFSEADRLLALSKAENEAQGGVGHKLTHLTEKEIIKMTYLSVDEAPHCVKCDKVVYKYDEQQAMGKIYHKNCFTCGGVGTQANSTCQKLLSLKAYGSHEEDPYCYNCLSKLFQISNSNTSGRDGLREPVVLKEDWEAEDPWAHTGIEEGKQFWQDNTDTANTRRIITEVIDVGGSNTNQKANAFIAEVKKLK